MNIALFWRFFASYFLLILTPVVAASVFTYSFVVRIIENDAAKLSNSTMRNFSDRTDALFSSLMTGMIHTLGSANLASLLAAADGAPENPHHTELLHALMEQLGKLESGELVSSAFLYAADRDLVVDYRTHTGKKMYFAHYYPLDRADQPAFFSHFTGKKMMVFTKPHTVHQKPLFSDNVLSSRSHISALMSYPFNTSVPDAYLAVNIDRDRLRELIRIRENWVTGTAIVDRSGRIVSQAGNAALAASTWPETIRSNAEGTLVRSGNGQALTFMKSRFHDDWYYVSLIDLQTLLKPARLIRTISAVFLGFVFILGSFVSYYLSRKLYSPIREIRTGLQSHRRADEPKTRERNDFDVIKRFSSLIISENKELAQLVSGMVPIVKEHFITQLLLGGYRDRLSIACYAKEIDFPYEPEAQRTVLCIELQYRSPMQERLPETSRTFLMAELKEKIRKLLPVSVWLCQTEPGLLACVVHHDGPGPFGPKEAAVLIQSILPQPYYKAAIGIGKTAHAIEELHKSYLHARTMLRYKGLHPEVEICSEEQAPDVDVPWDSFLSVHEVNLIFNRVKQRDFDGLLQSVGELLDAGMRRNANAFQVKCLCSDVLNTWIRAAGADRGDFSISVYAAMFDRLERCATWDEIRQCFRDIHAMLFRKEEPDARSVQLADILAHIRNHYGEELSIERFAEQMGMSVGHFSRVFKEEVGEKYVEYIARVRLSEAKRLLLDTDMKIDEIAERVGYWGRSSFIRVFRRYEGITPAQYRSAYRA